MKPIVLCAVMALVLATDVPVVEHVSTNSSANMQGVQLSHASPRDHDHGTSKAPKSDRKATG